MTKEQKEQKEKAKEEIKSTKDRKNIAKLPKKRSRLPDWKDLLGIAPDATGDLSSEEFVRNLRDEWQ